MPATTEPSQTPSDTPSGFFNSAFMEIESCFDFPASDTKSALEPSMRDSSPRSPRLTPSAPPSLVRPLSPTSVNVWQHLSDTSAATAFSSSFVPTLSSHTTTTTTTTTTAAQQASRGKQEDIAPIEITDPFVRQPSSPDPPADEPGKFGTPGDISPLDSLISHLPSKSARTVHGQVTPPEDCHRSPTLSHMSAPIIPTRVISPEQSPRTSPADLQRASDAHSAQDSQGGGASGKRRRSSTQSGHKPRKNPASEEPPEVQEAKRQRFLERNRMAASKCRQKKKAWIRSLENEAREAQNTGKQLKACIGMLKEEVLVLKNELLKHNACKCPQIRQYLNGEAQRFTDGSQERSSSSNNARASNSSSYLRTLRPSADMPECMLHPALRDGTDYDLDSRNSSA